MFGVRVLSGSQPRRGCADSPRLPRSGGETVGGRRLAPNPGSGLSRIRPVEQTPLPATPLLLRNVLFLALDPVRLQRPGAGRHILTSDCLAGLRWDLQRHPKFNLIS